MTMLRKIDSFEQRIDDFETFFAMGADPLEGSQMTQEFHSAGTRINPKFLG
jgi:hypothetical protein